jgi:RNA polymerase sigma-70 factor (ECF subfamily)
MSENAEFAALTLAHAAALYRMAYHLTGNAADADDLTQETYLRAFRGFAEFRGCNVRAWLFAILRHAFLDECRRHSRKPILLPVDDDLLAFSANGSSPTAPSAETEALGRLPDEALERAFAELPPDWRILVLLADVEDLSYREIADVLGMPTGTVMSRLHHARKRLRTRLLDSRPAAWHCICGPRMNHRDAWARLDEFLDGALGPVADHAEHGMELELTVTG